MAEEQKTPARVCDTCGAPATSSAVDMLRHEVPGENFIQFSPTGAVKFGCDLHPAVSEEYRTSQPAQR